MQWLTSHFLTLSIAIQCLLQTILTDAGCFPSFPWWVLFAFGDVVEFNVRFQQTLLSECLVTVLKGTLKVVVLRFYDKCLWRWDGLRNKYVVHCQINGTIF